MWEAGSIIRKVICLSYTNESNLIELCRQGDEQAWIELIRRYKDLINRYLRSVFLGASPEEIEDLTQEVFFRLIKGDLERFDPAKSRFSIYLGLISTRCTIDYLRSKNFRQHREYLTTFEDNFPKNPSNDSTEKIILKIGLDSLTEEEYSLIYLRYYEKMTMESIAAMKGVNKSTISRKINKILKKLS